MTYLLPWGPERWWRRSPLAWPVDLQRQHRQQGESPTTVNHSCQVSVPVYSTSFICCCKSLFPNACLCTLDLAGQTYTFQHSTKLLLWSRAIQPGLYQHGKSETFFPLRGMQSYCMFSGSSCQPQPTYRHSRPGHVRRAQHSPGIRMGIVPTAISGHGPKLTG